MTDKKLLQNFFCLLVDFWSEQFVVCFVAFFPAAAALRPIVVALYSPLVGFHHPWGLHEDKGKGKRVAKLVRSSVSLLLLL